MSKPFVPIEAAEIEWRNNKPYSPIFADVYFSPEDGLAEKQYVFIEGNQLDERWQKLTEPFFCIGELGFGTGLNFLLAWSLWLKSAPPNSKLFYYSCEKHPLRYDDLKRCLSLWPELAALAQLLLEQYPILTPGYHCLSFMDGRINLILMLGEAKTVFQDLLVCGDARLESQLRPNFINAWFLDGFAPKKNEAMWDKELIKIIALLSTQNTTLATYSVAALIKASLHEAGFSFYKKAGFGHKRNMLVAAFNQVNESIKSKQTPWHAIKLKPNKSKTAIIVGAGLAGCFTAYALAKRNWQVILLDSQDEIAQGASANTQAILYPQLSAYFSPLNNFMLAAYLFALRTYRHLFAEKGQFGEFQGILQLAYNEKEQINQNHLLAWLRHYPEIALSVDNRKASQLSGIPLQQSGLFIPQSGWVNIKKLCHYLIDHPNIEVHTGYTVSCLNQIGQRWYLGNFEADHVILANSGQAIRYSQTQSYPLKTIAGQITFIASRAESKRLKIPLCGNGHILPAHNGQHAIGATYHLNTTIIPNHEHDNQTNYQRLSFIDTPIQWPDSITGCWSGIRTATPDYLPLLGAVPDQDAFKLIYTRLADNAKRWIPAAGAYLSGLYLCAGFGSRGLTSIPLCADYLAGLLNNEPSCLPQSMIKTLAPARFLIRDIIRVPKLI